jgi:hypothetical protein
MIRPEGTIHLAHLSSPAVDSRKLVPGYPTDSAANVLRAGGTSQAMQLAAIKPRHSAPGTMANTIRKLGTKLARLMPSCQKSRNACCG